MYSLFSFMIEVHIKFSNIVGFYLFSREAFCFKFACQCQKFYKMDNQNKLLMKNTLSFLSMKVHHFVSGFSLFICKLNLRNLGLFWVSFDHHHCPFIYLYSWMIHHHKSKQDIFFIIKKVFCTCLRLVGSPVLECY